MFGIALLFNWALCILAPHPSTALTPFTSVDAPLLSLRDISRGRRLFIENLNASYRRGELCSPEFINNKYVTTGALYYLFVVLMIYKQRRTKFAPTIVLFIHIIKI